jgi:hypothetical protein
MAEAIRNDNSTLDKTAQLQRQARVEASSTAEASCPLAQES